MSNFISINNMKKQIIKALDLDTYISIQNGNLINIFYNKIDNENTHPAYTNLKDDKLKINKSNKSHPASKSRLLKEKYKKYKNSKLVKKTNFKNESMVNFLNKCIISLENFKNYILNDKEVIDYKYLWDLICKPNKNLFKNGINLIILEINSTDITNNVDLICPTNPYVNTLFDKNKETTILIKKGHYYEPIIYFEVRKDVIILDNLFDFKNKKLMPNLRITLENIKKYLNNKCVPLKSLPRVYKFKKGIILEKLLDILYENDIDVDTQVMNYDGKIIGVIINDETIKPGTMIPGTMIPCYPSSPINYLDYIWMDDYTGNNYTITKDILTNIYNLTNKTIPCLPVLKVIEQGLIVGIITETNQFVPISNPEQVIIDDLDIINSKSFSILDKKIINNDNKDNKRLKFIKYIKLETNFYNVFRNKVKLLLSEYENIETRENIEKIINSTDSYNNKLINIYNLLKILTNNKIIFSDYTEDILNDIDNITNCNMSDNCNENYCQLTDDNNCVTLIPRLNLINGLENSHLYHGKLSDEFIRYYKIRNYLLDSKTFFSFSNLNYNLGDNEIIVSETVLFTSFYNDLKPMLKYDYEKFNTRDTTLPLNTFNYSNQIYINKDQELDLLNNIERSIFDIDKDFDDEIKESYNKEIEEKRCEVRIKKLTSKWNNIFPKNSTENIFNIYPNEKICSFELLIRIIKYNNNLDINTNEIKEILIEKYNQYIERYLQNIINIFYLEGKQYFLRVLMMKNTTLDILIMSNKYYITNLDIWLISKHFNIPIIMYSSTKLVENNKDVMLINRSDNNKYFFIRAPGIKRNVSNVYRLLVYKRKYKISLENFKKVFQTKIKKQIDDNSDDVSEYIKNFKLKIKKNKRRIKLK